MKLLPIESTINIVDRRSIIMLLACLLEDLASLLSFVSKQFSAQLSHPGKGENAL